MAAFATAAKKFWSANDGIQRPARGVVCNESWDRETLKDFDAFSEESFQSDQEKASFLYIPLFVWRAM